MSKVDDTSIISGKVRKLGYENYAQYLESDHWLLVKAKYRASLRPQNCKCGAPAQALHHLSYLNLGAELMTDLEAICHKCHKKEHRRQRAEKRAQLKKRKQGRKKKHKLTRKYGKLRKSGKVKTYFICPNCSGPHSQSQCIL